MKKDVPIKRKVNHRPDPREQARAASGVKRRKRRLRKYTIYYILLLLIVLTAMITLSMTVFFNIRAFDVQQTGEYTAEQLIASTGVQKGDNLLRLDTKKIRQELLKQYINLDDVEVKRKLPDTLQIICIPSEVKCSIQTDGGYLYISNGNRILEINQPEPKAGTVVIKGCTVEQPEKGKYLSELHVSDIDRLRKLQEILGMIEFPDITSIDISNPLQTDITYQNRIVIQIQCSDDMEYLLQAAKKIIQEDIGVSETGRIFYVQSTQSIHFLPEAVE